MCWEGSEFKEIEEMENMVDLPADQAIDVEPVVLKSLKIAAVYSLENFYKCLRYSSRTEPWSETESRCCNTQCGILSNSSFCEKFSTAEILIIHGPTSDKVVLSAFGDEIITELVGSSENSATEEAIIRSPPIVKLVHRNNEIVSSAVKETATETVHL